MKKIFVLILLVSPVVTYLISCKVHDTEQQQPSKPVEESQLVSITHVSDISSSDLQYFANSFGFTELKYKLIYDVSVEKVVYKTTYKGNSISASGLIYIPKSADKPLPVLSAHHGTTFRKADAPSMSYGISEEAFAASSGFITFAPDYIGYGSSAEIFHPYYDEYHSAKTIIDMIKAGKEALRRKEIEHNSKLFLMGYSEGGYVTLAAQKAIEKDTSIGMSLAGVAAGAGGYDLTNMLNEITSTNYYSYPAYLAFVLQSFNTTYNWNLSLNYFFQDQYAEKLTLGMDGSHSGGQINNFLTTRVDSLFNQTFYQNLKKTSGELSLKEALLKNSLANWKPASPLRLYHGTADEVIPYQNSQDTYAKFKESGADVKLIPIQGGTHGSSFIPMIKSAFPWFEELNNKVE